MMNRVRDRFKAWRLGERGLSSAAIFILALPLLCGAMGYSIDMTRVIFVKKYVQDRADLAVQGAISEVDVTGGTINITNVATNAAVTLYCNNTASKRMVHGMLSGACVASANVDGAPISSTAFCANLVTGTRYGIALQAVETVPMTFLKLVGINEYKLTNIKSTAYLRARNC
jgi:uncharacterized membrane protein